MRDLLATVARPALWSFAVAYLCLAAPLDLAVSLTRLIGGPAVPGAARAVSIAARVVDVAIGLGPIVWAGSALATLAVIAASLWSAPRGRPSA